MYCSKCGKQVDDNANFCKYCGNDLSSDRESLTATDRVSVEPTKDTDTAKQNVTNVEGNSSTADAINTQDTKFNMDTSSLMEGTLSPKQEKRRKARRQREIEDAIALDNYTIKDDMVSEAKTLDKSRIVLTKKGSLKSLKAREIALIVLFAVIMIVATAIVAIIHNTNKANEDNMNALVIVGYFLFFVLFFALAMGVDRVYNLLTLNELIHRRITLKKFGFRLTPLALKGDEVYTIEIDGECDMCETDIKGSYHIEWQNDELIAVCNFDRKHLYRIDINDILDDADTLEIGKASSENTAEPAIETGCTDSENTHDHQEK